MRGNWRGRPDRWTGLTKEPGIFELGLWGIFNYRPPFSCLRREGAREENRPTLSTGLAYPPVYLVHCRCGAARHVTFRLVLSYAVLVWLVNRSHRLWLHILPKPYTLQFYMQEYFKEATTKATLQQSRVKLAEHLRNNVRIFKRLSSVHVAHPDVTTQSQY